MDRFLSRFFCALFVLITLPMYGQITTPYFYDNIHSNFSGTGIGANAYRSSLGVHSHRFTFLANFTGNNFYKINNQSDNNDNNFNLPSGSKVWSGGLSLNTLGTAFAYGDGSGGAGSFPVTSGKYVTYNWQDVNTSSDAAAIVMQTDNDPVSIVSTTALPLFPVPSLPVIVTVVLTNTPSAQENVFLRYSTNGFATYGTLLSPSTGAGTATQTFTIPAQPLNTAVSYYVFTTTLASGTLSGQGTLTDMATINFDNNGGSNFLYVSLPIELTAFQAEKTDRSVVLHWTTATEQNNDRFELERAPDGSHWSLLSMVPSQNGNARFPQHYSAQDPHPWPARNYYRLRQVDTDGKFTYSPVRIVDMGGTATATIFPNPVVNDALQLVLPATELNAQVRLTDVQGRLLRQWTFNMETEWSGTLDLSGVPAGIFFLQVNGELPIRVVKQ